MKHQTLGRKLKNIDLKAKKKSAQLETKAQKIRDKIANIQAQADKKMNPLHCQLNKLHKADQQIFIEAQNQKAQILPALMTACDKANVDVTQYLM